MRRIILLLLLAGIVFADVGPSQSKPEITVALLKDGKPYAEPLSLGYVCTEPVVGNDTMSPVGQRTTNFTCDKGTCTNSAWFYKFNPCYYGGGYFEYASPVTGAPARTNSLNFSKAGNYNVELELKNDEAVIRSSSSCTTALALLGALAFVAFRE